MSKSRQDGQMKKIFAQLRGKSMGDFELVAEIIKDGGGQLLQAYPPGVIIAEIYDDRIDELRESASVEFIETDEISEERIKNAEGDIGSAMAAWNEHIKKKRLSADLTTGLSWDTPGRLPPDAPPEIQKMLREREREMQSKRKSHKGGA